MAAIAAHAAGHISLLLFRAVTGKTALRKGVELLAEDSFAGAVVVEHGRDLHCNIRHEAIAALEMLLSEQLVAGSLGPCSGRDMTEVRIGHGRNNWNIQFRILRLINGQTGFFIPE